jgi:ribosome-associated protein
MDRDARLEIAPGLALPVTELRYRASRSGGPGGQHVNTSSTRVEVVWDVARSPSLSADQRDRLRARLGPRLDAAGRLRLVASASRSQLQNRREVTERLRRLVARALDVPRPRTPTRPGPAADTARLEAKRRRSALKRERRLRPGFDE